MSDLKLLKAVVEGILEDEVWENEWCPVCHEHPTFGGEPYHGGNDDCPLRLAIERVGLTARAYPDMSEA